jgi:hypothetical protein
LAAEAVASPVVVVVVAEGTMASLVAEVIPAEVALAIRCR